MKRTKSVLCLATGVLAFPLCGLSAPDRKDPEVDREKEPKPPVENPADDAAAEGKKSKDAKDAEAAKDAKDQESRKGSARSSRDKTPRSEKIPATRKKSDPKSDPEPEEESKDGQAADPEPPVPPTTPRADLEKKVPGQEAPRKEGEPDQERRGDPAVEPVPPVPPAKEGKGKGQDKDKDKGKDDPGKRPALPPVDRPDPPTPEQVGERDPAHPDPEESGERPEGLPGTPAGEADPENEVVEKAAEKVREEADRKKLALDDPNQARKLIEDILGTRSALSQAEAQRARREAARTERQEPGRRPPGQDRPAAERGRERSDAITYLRKQLLGELTPAQEPPVFLRRSDRLPPPPDRDRDRDRDQRPPNRDNGRFDLRDAQYPPHLHDGRRFVRYRSRTEIPAILLAASVLDWVRVDRGREATFLPDRGPDAPRAQFDPEPPRSYREPDSYVVSYRVDEASMVSRDDILFQQGATEFADGYSYDLVLALAEAMAHPSLANQRFIVEGHASAEGSFALNMDLSQRRAERIVRDMVRSGISPDRLIPVGHGESEARYPADAAEAVRRQDRRVTVFRLGE